MQNKEIEFDQLKENNLNTIDEMHALFPQWKRKSILKKINETRKGKSLRFVAKKKGKIVAHVNVVLGQGIHSHRAEMLSLCVLESERGRGIAKALTKFVIEQLPDRVCLVTLAVDKTNKKALGLYKKLGFKKYGFLEKASFIKGKCVDNFLMKKTV